MTIIDGDTLKEAYKNAANIDDREKETAYKMIDQQIVAQKEKFDMLVYDTDWTVWRVAEQNLPKPKFSRPKSKGKVR